MAKGKLMGQEINQMGEQGVALRKMLADNMGVSIQQVMDMGEKGLITFELLDKILKQATSQGGMYFGGMDAKMKTLSGTFSVMQDSASIAMINFGGMFAKALDLRNVFTKVSNALENLNKKFDNLDPFYKKFISYSLTAGIVVPIASMAIIGLAKAFNVLKASMMWLRGSALLAGFGKGGIDNLLKAVKDKGLKGGILEVIAGSASASPGRLLLGGLNIGLAGIKSFGLMAFRFSTYGALAIGAIEGLRFAFQGFMGAFSSSTKVVNAEVQARQGLLGALWGFIKSLGNLVWEGLKTFVILIGRGWGEFIKNAFDGLFVVLKGIAGWIDKTFKTNLTAKIPENTGKAIDSATKGLQSGTRFANELASDNSLVQSYLRGDTGVKAGNVVLANPLPKMANQISVENNITIDKEGNVKTQSNVSDGSSVKSTSNIKRNYNYFTGGDY
jgi:hypothetical protein